MLTAAEQGACIPQRQLQQLRPCWPAAARVPVLHCRCHCRCRRCHCCCRRCRSLLCCWPRRCKFAAASLPAAAPLPFAPRCWLPPAARQGRLRAAQAALQRGREAAHSREAATHCPQKTNHTPLLPPSCPTPKQARRKQPGHVWQQPTAPFHALAKLQPRAGDAAQTQPRGGRQGRRGRGWGWPVGAHGVRHQPQALEEGSRAPNKPSAASQAPHAVMPGRMAARTLPILLNGSSCVAPSGGKRGIQARRAPKCWRLAGQAVRYCLKWRPQ